MAVRFDDPFQLVCALDPNALKILLVMVCARNQGRRPPVEKDLQIWANLSQNPVRTALGQLEIYGLVAHRDGEKGWHLTDGALQLPLMDTLLESGKSQLMTLFADDAPDESAPLEIIPSSPPSSTDLSTGLSTETSENREETANREEKESLIDSFSCPSSSGSLNNLILENPLPPDSSGADEQSKIDSCLLELDRQGIREPARSRLARLPKVDKRLIRYHCETAANAGMAIYRIGAIYRVKKGWYPEGRDGPTLTNRWPEELPDVDEVFLQAWDDALHHLESKWPPGLFFDCAWDDMLSLWLVEGGRCVVAVLHEHLVELLDGLDVPEQLREWLGAKQVVVEVKPWES